MKLSPEIKKVCWKTVDLNDLNIRYIPVVTPLSLWKTMVLPESPHVELMKLLFKYGLNWKKIKKSRYFIDRQHRYSVGLTKWTNNTIMSHIKVRYYILKSIANKGIIRKPKNSTPICILKEPFWKTRFGIETPNSGYEIWNGAGRCSAAYALGFREVEVLLCEDKMPGSENKGKFLNKLKNVKGVFSD